MKPLGQTVERQVAKCLDITFRADLARQIDILEGVNDHGTNSVTLHTSSGCTMPVPGSGETGYNSNLLDFEHLAQSFPDPP